MPWVDTLVRVVVEKFRSNFDRKVADSVGNLGDGSHTSQQTKMWVRQSAGCRISWNFAAEDCAPTRSI